MFKQNNKPMNNPKRNFSLVAFDIETRYHGSHTIDKQYAYNEFSEQLKLIQDSIRHYENQNSYYRVDRYAEAKLYKDNDGNLLPEEAYRYGKCTVLSTAEKLQQLREAELQVYLDGEPCDFLFKFFVTPQAGPFADSTWQVQYEYYSDDSGKKNCGYWMGYIRNETRFQKLGGGQENNIWITFGFSNYKNNLKYIIEGISRYLSGEKHLVYNDWCYLTPEMTDEDVENLKKKHLKRKREDLQELYEQTILETEFAKSVVEEEEL